MCPKRFSGIIVFLYIVTVIFVEINGYKIIELDNTFCNIRVKQKLLKKPYGLGVLGIKTDT